jgi:hypothetical protein
MKKAALAAGAVLAFAALGWRATRSAPPASPDPAALAKLAELQDVLLARNDNDPRLDGDFNALTPQARRLFREAYARLPPEKRNERGTIVYLLGRNSLDADDWAFLRGVVSEPPCLSLADCGKKPRTSDDEAVGDEVTLAYPPLVALNQLEPRISTGKATADVAAVLAAGRKSASPAVARLAARLSARFAAATHD